MSKLIVIAGIKRSGSTWLYNAVRLCLKHAGYSVHIAGDGQYYDPNCKVDYQIVKKHPFDPALAEAADYVFTSDRDDEGIKASWERFSGEKLTDEKLATWRGWLDRWEEYSCYDIYYPPSKWTFQNIHATLIESQFNSAWEELQGICPPIDKDYDPETLLFRNHITSR